MFKNKYTVIACVNNGGAIAKDGKLLYKIGCDLKNFARLTTDNVVIMGRKTFETLPNGLPLKDRVNIVITSQDNYNVKTDNPDLFKDTYVCNSLEEADNLCYSLFPDKELFIIGGGTIYDEAFIKDIVDKAIITLVNDETDGDVYFPLFDVNKYKVIFKTTSLRDQPTDLYYHYIVYKRNAK